MVSSVFISLIFRIWIPPQTLVSVILLWSGPVQENLCTDVVTCAVHHSSSHFPIGPLILIFYRTWCHFSMRLLSALVSLRGSPADQYDVDVYARLARRDLACPALLAF